MDYHSINPKSVYRNVKLRVSVVLGFTLVAFTATTTDAQEQQTKKSATLGLVQQKPSSGRFVKTNRGFMVPYKATIPGTKVTFEMVPIPGGTFTMGSPATEKHRKKGEGPQFEVVVEPFWIGKYEVTWGEYQEYMGLYRVFRNIAAMREILAPIKENDPSKKKKIRRRQDLLKLLEKHPKLKVRLATPDKKIDAITAPSQIYDPGIPYESGEDPRLPAVTMTQYSAKQYTKWLSHLTEHVYRLPAEAEWEYACRAGTTTAYHFGDDPKKLSEFGWHYDNADDKAHIVGKLKPNPWGLYDMHGNVAEWVLDEYREPGYKKTNGRPLTVAQSLVWPTRLDPRILRGGYWDDEPDRLRSSARMKSNVSDWKNQDPSLPQSPWWFTSYPASGVGFRLVRPLTAPSKQEKAKLWDADVKSIRDDVHEMLEQMHGTQGTVDPQFPKAIKSLEAIKQSNP